MVNAYVQIVPRADAAALLANYHYLGKKAFIGVYIFGLFVDGVLVGACSFSPPSAPETVVGAFGLARHEQSTVFELSRFVLSAAHNGKNYGSMLLGRAIRLLKQLVKVDAIITYADSERHVGALYQATNFHYCGLTTPKKDFYLPCGKLQSRGKTKGVAGEWRPRSQKHRYVLICSNRLNLKWPIQTYPKELKIA